MKVLFEDNHAIAVVKEHGVPVVGDKTGDRSLFDEVKSFLKAKDKKPGEVYLGLVHRLDRPVGGVVLFAKTSKGAARLSEQFRLGEVEKVYWAVVEGRSEADDGNVIEWLKKDAALNRTRAFKTEEEGSKRAELSYRVLKATDGRSLIEIRPKTGRSHQIRVAMSGLGCPIVGDVKYGASKGLQGSIALFARSLTFRTVVGKQPVTITAEPSLSIFNLR